MELKQDLLYREDSLLIKAEPRLHSPGNGGGGGGTVGVTVGSSAATIVTTGSLNTTGTGAGSILLPNSNGLVTIATIPGDGLVGVSLAGVAAASIQSTNVIDTISTLSNSSIITINSNAIGGNGSSGGGNVISPSSLAGATLNTNGLSTASLFIGTSGGTTSGGGGSVSVATVAAAAATVTGTSNGNSSKRSRTEDWLSSSSPGAVSVSVPPLTPSPGPPSHTYTTVISNGYSSPMSSGGSYDPYSPNGKIGREDLSPPNSLNGFSADSCDGKKKKGPTPRQQEELCLVCGDRASGYHYNALTCEGCKGFFRRSITKNAVYQCKYGNNCEIDMYMRRKCQECRLKKCLSVGMRPECVVPEVQCAVKRKEKKAQKAKDAPNSTTNGSPDIVKTEPELCDPENPLSGGERKISPEQEELIHRLVYFQNEYEHPSEEDVKRIINQPVDEDDPCDMSYRHITEITILTVQLIVEFAKRLPGFDKLLREDQIALLKACSSEVMMFRMARRYDVQTDSILFVNNQPYSRDSYSLAGMSETIEDLLRFCRTMYSMKVDNAEYALLTAIVIFSERPQLIEGWKVEKIQEIYLEALRAYVDNRRKPKAGIIFAKLLSVLTELRNLGKQNSEMCFSLKLKNKKLPPFLAEIWDIDYKT